MSNQQHQQILSQIANKTKGAQQWDKTKRTQQWNKTKGTQQWGTNWSKWLCIYARYGHFSIIIGCDAAIASEQRSGVVEGGWEGEKR